MSNSNQVLLNPEKVIASYENSSHRLIIEASGREEGLRNIKIEESPTPIEPPEFVVVGEKSKAIGDFPYDVKAHFNLPKNPQTIIIHTSEGDKKYHVVAK